jgi:hypothetical protein
MIFEIWYNDNDVGDLGDLGDVNDDDDDNLLYQRAVGLLTHLHR